MPHRDLPWVAPEDAAFHLARHHAGCRFVLFHSAGRRMVSSPVSYLAVAPRAVVSVGGLDAVAALLNEAGADPCCASAAEAEDGLFAFRGGLAGYVGYEAGAASQGVAPRHDVTPDDPPDLWFGLFDLVVGFDHARRLTRVHLTRLAGREPEMARLDWAVTWLGAATRAAGTPVGLPRLTWRDDWIEAAYRRQVARVLAYIRAGDIFQANFTQAFVAARPAALCLASVQARLLAANPAPFGLWLRGGVFDVISASPERFVALDRAGCVTTSPIKGTAGRADDATADLAAARALAASEKDRAENIMIVDVLRNDIGRVAQLGSVAVPALCEVMSFATVHHLVSTITGRLAPGKTAFDLLAASLPGGSITGAPKIRAMQIIAELEAARRGPYCGTACWIGFDGAMDSNILIRSLVATPHRLIAQAGGGIVADSDPAEEYAEMRLKVAPVLNLFGGEA